MFTSKPQFLFLESTSTITMPKYTPSMMKAMNQIMDKIYEDGPAKPILDPKDDPLVNARKAYDYRVFIKEHLEEKSRETKLVLGQLQHALAIGMDLMKKLKKDNEKLYQESLEKWTDLKKKTIQQIMQFVVLSVVYKKCLEANQAWVGHYTLILDPDNDYSKEGLYWILSFDDEGKEVYELKEFDDDLKDK